MADNTALLECEALLKQMLMPNTEAIRAAVAELNNRLKKAETFSVLLKLLMQHPLEGVLSVHLEIMCLILLYS